jgi:hypothetical protein
LAGALEVEVEEVLEVEEGFVLWASRRLISD